MTGTVLSLSSPDFTLNASSMPQCVFNAIGIACPQYVALIPYDVVTTAQTGYQGFTPDDFSGIADNDEVSVNGWLFPSNAVSDNTNSASTPTVIAQTVTLHTGGVF